MFSKKILLVRNITKAEKTAKMLTIAFLAFYFLAGRLSFAQEDKQFQADVEAGKVKYVGSDTCAACHEKIARDFSTSTHAKMSVPGADVQAQGCESCHGPGSKHVDAGGGKGVFIVNPSKNPEACFKCHIEKKMEFALQYHHPVPEGRISCNDCHDPHKDEVKPWTATSFNRRNEVCFKCHADKRGPFVFPHEATAESCTICHSVHGSINDKMLIMRDATLCLQCHAQPNYPTMGKNTSHGGVSGYLTQGTCFSGGCHTGIHGSNYDDHLRR